MEFHVNLIKVPAMDKMTSWDVFALMVNARHLSGPYWLYEGEMDGLKLSGDVELIDTGITGITGDMSDPDLLEYCQMEVFEEDFDASQPGWKMLTEREKLEIY